MRIAAALACAALLALLVAARTLGAAGPCDGLAGLVLPNATITSAATVEAGAFTSPAAGNAERWRGLPSFCRVAATLKPSPDSEIKIEVWLPSAGWNHKFQAVGNGAFSGAIAHAAMAAALGRGYAAGSTDTGHEGGSARFGFGHPEKVIDFGWRAVHEMTVAAKKIVAAHYGAGATYSYWNGCSAGGRQAMKEAQRFPADFDGIIAGAPGLDWTGRAAQAVRVAQPLMAHQDARLSRMERELLHGAVIAACDAIDGVKDGLIENPRRCAFDPGVLQCKGPSRDGCLSADQAATARMIYAAATNPESKRDISGLERGSELGWTDLGWTASARATGLDQFRYLVFGDPQWDETAFRFETDIVKAERADGDTLNALDPNLKPFIDRGGKVIQYHGWNDPQIAPGSSTQYYQRVQEAIGSAVALDRSYRLFMAPGMAHCGGGEGPNTFDMVTALEQWVEHGTAPDRIVASHMTGAAADRTRPLCPYPQVAVYNGSGSTDSAANFACRTR
ncbi:MAG TPA: tannase/feruloyl esterase family alpha/beta hydrolase [Vicinamibacterales bacterium]|nr:tannase/feruloyl esterase family alpha/beta hydrolase [Vicinamibacterales bacterium]